jgi:hypothetical protein
MSKQETKQLTTQQACLGLGCHSIGGGNLRMLCFINQLQSTPTALLIAVWQCGGVRSVCVLLLLLLLRAWSVLCRSAWWLQICFLPFHP